MPAAVADQPRELSPSPQLIVAVKSPRVVARISVGERRTAEIARRTPFRRGQARGAIRPLLLTVVAAGLLPGQKTPKITTPKEALGFNIGDDYQMATYTQLEVYWKKLAAESDRMKLVDIGKTGFGRPQYMAIISSPENI